MKIKIFVMLCVLALAPMPLLSAGQDYEKPISGMEWLEQSIVDRLERVRVSMVILHTHGIPVTESSNDYYNALEKKIKREPEIAQSDLTSILASVIYELDPSAREALDKFRRT